MTVTVCLLLLGGASAGPTGLEPLTEVMDMELPTPMAATNGVSDGQAVYTFGGFGAQGRSDEVLRYDPEADTVSVVAHLPSPRSGAAAVRDDSSGLMYVIGGFDGSYLKQILAFDPSSQSVTVLSAELPNGLTTAMAAWDGRDRPDTGCPGGCVTILGGNAGGVYQDTVVRFNPTTGSVVAAGWTLPVPIIRGAAGIAPGADHVVLVGGFGGGLDASSSNVLDDIYVLDLETGAAVNHGTLPTPLYKIQSAWIDGTHAWVAPSGCIKGCFLVAGGQSSRDSDPSYEMSVLILRGDGTIAVHYALLNEAKSGSALAVIGSEAYVLGGRGDAGWTAAIERIELDCTVANDALGCLHAHF